MFHRLPTIQSLLTAALVLPCSISAQHIASYGSGSAGSGSVTPALWCNSTPRPGNTGFALSLERGLGGAPAIAFMSTSRASLNLNGLNLLVDLTVGFSLGATVLSGTGAGSGTGSIAAPLPNLAVVNGLPLHFQAYVLDPRGPFLGLAATQGLTATSRSGGALFAAPNIRVALPQLVAGSFNSGAGSANALAMSRDGSRVFVSGRVGTSGRPIVALDATKNPPTTIKTWSLVDTKTTAWTLTVNPNGRYLYATNQGPSSTTPKIEAFYLDSARFGQAVPGNVLDPKSISAIRILFNRSGLRGYVATLGIGGAPALVEYDTLIGGQNQHKELRRVRFSGKFIFDAQLSPDDNIVYVSAASLGQVGEISLINARTMQRVDWDLRTPGIQSIGGEVSRPRTPLGRVQASIAIDARHRYLYAAVSGGAAGSASLVRVVVDRSHPDFGKFVTYSTGLPAREQLGNVLVSPAGDTVFLSLRSSRRLHVITSTSSALRQKKVLTLRSAASEMAYR